MRVVPTHGPARRTFLFDTLKAIPGGCVETLGLTFSILIAVRVFEAGQWAKASLVAAPSFGLLLSLFVVQFVRRSGISVNVGVALIWAVSAVSLAVAALGGQSFPVFFAALLMALVNITLGTPLMSQIYRKHYPDQSRGRLFATTGVVRKLSALVVAAFFGWLLRNDLGHFRWLLATYSAGCFFMALCVLGMNRVHLQRARQVRLFGAFGHVRRDAPFRKLLISWMILGLGNLLCFSLFVEYVSNPDYGFELDEFSIGFITGSIPEIMFLVFVVAWGVVFDRVNFFLVRLLINALFIIGILFYFLGGGVWALAVGIGIHGIARAGGSIAWSLWVTKFAEGDHVAEYMSVHTFLCGLRGVLAPFVAFPLAREIGPELVGLIGATLIAVASLLIWPSVRLGRSGRDALPVEPDPRAS
jgi:hypothetical protein